MKLNFVLPNDNATHNICLFCHADGVKTIKVDGKTAYKCPKCGRINNRRIYVGPDEQWTANNKTWWHKSAGVFVRNPECKFLFFELTTFPFGFTVPAGHVSRNEEPIVTAGKELEEEVGIMAHNLRHVVSVDINGDSCSGGSDDHRWYVYVEKMPELFTVTICPEGKNPTWLTLEEAKAKQLPVPIRYILDHYQHEIESV